MHDGTAFIALAQMFGGQAFAVGGIVRRFFVGLFRWERLCRNVSLCFPCVGRFGIGRFRRRLGRQQSPHAAGTAIQQTALIIGEIGFADIAR